MEAITPSFLFVHSLLLFASLTLLNVYITANLPSVCFFIHPIGIVLGTRMFLSIGIFLSIGCWWLMVLPHVQRFIGNMFSPSVVAISPILIDFRYPARSSYCVHG